MASGECVEPAEEMGWLPLGTTKWWYTGLKIPAGTPLPSCSVSKDTIMVEPNWVGVDS